MRHVVAIVVALTFCACGMAIGGVRVVDPLRAALDAPFDPTQSAALFVGVRDFTHDKTLTEVRYAVDDAVDLAYLLAIESKPALVSPERVVLALSGEAQKPQSRERLAALVAAGAQEQHAELSDILLALERQARAAEGSGLLIFAFATHGINDDGAQYLLAADSLLRRHHETAIAETTVRNIASESHAGRSLVLIDACRKKLTSDSRGEPDPRCAAALVRAMSRIHGQVVFSAAAAGEYAYDDDVRKNGVFTAAIIDGLRCALKRQPNGIITADALATMVNAQVLTWIQKHHDPYARRGTQFTADGMAKSMPLAICGASRR
jgi:uncharacterized caspase-like protein